MKKIQSILYICVMAFGLLTMNACTETESCSDGIQNQNETGIDCGGDCSACATCNDGIQNGDETGVDCGGSECDECLIGINGTWESAADNVAVLLQPFASKLVATFNTDGTYTVVQTDLDGAEITLEGNYAQTESSVDGIWTIVLNQSTPSQLTAEGIFTFEGDLLKYEVAQTNPALTGVTAPTPEAGLGSTSGGFFGTDNVQTYIKL